VNQATKTRKQRQLRRPRENAVLTGFAGRHATRSTQVGQLSCLCGEKIAIAA
jgi:hypothetical protein